MFEIMQNVWEWICSGVLCFIGLCSLIYFFTISVYILCILIQDIFWFFGHHIFFKGFKFFFKKKEICMKCVYFSQRERECYNDNPCDMACGECCRGNEMKRFVRRIEYFVNIHLIGNDSYADRCFYELKNYLEKNFKTTDYEIIGEGRFHPEILIKNSKIYEEHKNHTAFNGCFIIETRWCIVVNKDDISTLITDIKNFGIEPYWFSSTVGLFDGKLYNCVCFKNCKMFKKYLKTISNWA